ncbi:MAG: sulfite reductase [Nitrospina sp.]|nr:sulfite reductase [Nitrospina sp.]|tara:strand:- start:10229 stop:12607 length:2379 start_codon:yes stop_codon:yes gene_type:complete
MDAKSLNIPEEVKREIDTFAAEVERLNRGEVGDEDFKRFRLQQGIYGQRQEGEQMVRTKLPAGKITSSQLQCLADFAEKYSHGILHITTRQDIQLHYVKINDVPQGLEDLAQAGITTREACGNTVRNVTACHKAGTCTTEAFDVSPYALAVSKYLLRQDLTQNLPRKFKISFGGCNGCGLAPIHDIGLKAVIKNENEKEVRGFRVLVGGGLGSFPHGALPLTDFIPESQLLRMCEALVAVFDKYGDKKNRNKARFKFVLDKLGLKKIKELYDEEFSALENKAYAPIQIEQEKVPNMPEYKSADCNADPEFQLWKSRNVESQKQAGFHNIQVKLILGDFSIPQARALADISKNFAGAKLVATVNQNLMIPWVKEDAFGNIFNELKKIGLHKAGTEEIRDITCCPGSETCNLGITASRGLVDTLHNEMENGFETSKDMDHITIKASGCPNSCGQHHIASIGFHGGAKKLNGILTPHYEVLLGGRISEDKVVFGTSVIKIPAKNAPKAMKSSINDYKNNKKDNETFGEYFDRMGKRHFRELLDPLKTLPNIEQSPESYIDYGTTEKFSLEDRGQGECAGAVTDMITDRITEAERAHFQGKLAIEKKLTKDAGQHAQRSVIASARALLVTEGMDFNDDWECLKKFQSLVIDMEIVSSKFAKLIDQFEKVEEVSDEKMAESWVNDAGLLVDECKTVQEKMQSDKSLRIRVGGDNPKEKINEKATQASIDLLGVKCPFNYVKTKIKLETMPPGSILEVLLDDGEPSENVPKSIKNDGHKVISLVEEQGHYKLTIEKVC